MTVALLGLLASCDFSGGDEVTALDNTCNGECAAGVCEDGICVSDSEDGVEVVIEVLQSATDTESDTPLSWAFEPEGFSQVTERAYVLPAITEVIGTVRWGELRVPADLRFTRIMSETLRPVSPTTVEVVTLREPSQSEGGMVFDYSTRLVAGARYDLVVEPTSDVLLAFDDDATSALGALPPLYINDIGVEASPGLPFEFSIDYPSSLVDPCGPARLTDCTLSGRILSTDGETEIAQPGLRVRAVQRETGRVVSSITETNELGVFEVRVSAQAGEYVLRVTPGTGPEAFPSLSFDPAFFFPQDPVLRILVPRIQPVQFSGRVTDSAERAVPNAAVQLFSDAIFDPSLQIVGSFSGSATTDPEGRFSASLLPGVYQITVTPPEDVETTWGVLEVESQRVRDGTEDVDLRVPSQVALRGAVQTFGADPAGGVTIQARSLGRPLDGARTQQTTSDLDGVYGMSLDEGIYDVSVRVTSESGFPWLVQATQVFGRDAERNYTLPPPVVVRGTVRSSDSTPVSAAPIRAYVLLPALSEDGQRPLQVAETQTDEDGNYRLLFAPILNGE